MLYDFLISYSWFKSWRYPVQILQTSGSNSGDRGFKFCIQGVQNLSSSPSSKQHFRIESPIWHCEWRNGRMNGWSDASHGQNACLCGQRWPLRIQSKHLIQRNVFEKCSLKHLILIQPAKGRGQKEKYRQVRLVKTRVKTKARTKARTAYGSLRSLQQKQQYRCHSIPPNERTQPRQVHGFPSPPPCGASTRSRDTDASRLARREYHRLPQILCCTRAARARPLAFQRSHSA
jgi:hypothetical protein